MNKFSINNNIINVNNVFFFFFHFLMLEQVKHHCWMKNQMVLIAMSQLNHQIHQWTQ